MTPLTRWAGRVIDITDQAIIVRLTPLDGEPRACQIEWAPELFTEAERAAIAVADTFNLAVGFEQGQPAYELQWLDSRAGHG